MPRRQTAPKGKLRCVEWPEWHADCAEPGCDEETLIVPTGEAMSLKAAEAQATIKNVEGWDCVRREWRCSAHQLT
jgi:hypothetical protein